MKMTTLVVAVLGTLLVGCEQQKQTATTEGSASGYAFGYKPLFYIGEYA